MINKREPMNSDNIITYKASTGAYAQTDSSAEAGHQSVDMFHAISQPKPGDKIMYTARLVPHSVQARQARMDADLQGRNPASHLLHPDGGDGADPRLRALTDRGGPGGRRSRNRRRGGRRDRRRSDRRQSPAPPGDEETEREMLDNEMLEYFARGAPPNPGLADGNPIEEDRFMHDA